MQLVLTNTALTKIATARAGGDKVSITQFQIGFTSGSVGPTDTSVPGSVFGPEAINSAFLADTNSAQFECIVPEEVGPFNFNVLGLLDADSDLIAIAKMDSALAKTASNLPEVIGNRIVLRAQMAINNADGVLNFSLNILANANLNFVTIVDALSALAVSGIYKTYRVLGMPDGFSDIATTNGIVWSFGRYVPIMAGVAAGTGGGLGTMFGDFSKPFKSQHVGGIVQITSGPNLGQVRPVTSVSEANNSITCNNFPAVVTAGTSFIYFQKIKSHGSNYVVVADEIGYASSDSNFMFDLTNKRVAVRTTTPLAGYHQLGGGHRLQKILPAGGPSVNPQGTPGSTTYLYFIVAEDYEGNKAVASGGGSTNSGNATLTGSNFNRITWSGSAGAKRYAVLKGNLTTLVGYSTSTTFDDVGQSTSAYVTPSRNETADMTVDGRVILGEDPFGNMDATTRQWVSSLVDLIVPIGSIKMWPTAGIPTGWVSCSGQLLSTSAFPALFALIGYFYGGSGANFAVPNLTGRSPIGPGISDAPNAVTNFLLGNKYGEERHVQTPNEMASHGHTYVQPSGTGGFFSSGLGGGTVQNATTLSVGGNAPANIVHPVTALYFIMRAA